MNLFTPQTRSFPSASQILRPGNRVLPPNVERYQVRGGGSLLVDVKAGDQLRLTDIEGGQIVEMAFCDAKGRSDLSSLSAKAGTIGQVFAAMALIDGRLRAGLARRSIEIAKIKTTHLFGEASPAGNNSDFTVKHDGTLIVAAPAADMNPDAQNTATDIELRITRVHPRLKTALDDLPEPLADPMQDIRIKAATARSFQVQAGEYIQIIDVSGRQMTDFQCFSSRKLDKGIEQALDATITRTLTGRAYPIPGLPSKAFALDFEPLIEVVQDTCGRHDAFATACNPRFYDDMGYPGHANCTENFNFALDTYGIAKRKGWEALNFFYNTHMDHSNIIVSDEAWSRAGDYVLVKALTDLVCVTSSCPDDIDPGNGWNPTDIHVRVYSATQKFQRAVATRMTPDADPVMTKETAFHSSFSKLTRNYAEYRGYWLPNRFNNEGPTEEYWAAREKAVVMDLSPLRKFEVTGPDAEALLQYCMTRDISKLSTGQVVYTAMCYENGGMIDDGTVFKLGQNLFRFIGGDDYSGVWLREQAEKMGYKAWVRSSTDQLHNIAVQGPNSREILKDILWTSPTQPNISEIEWFRFTVARIGHFEGVPLVVSRTGYTGELGYEIFCHPKHAIEVFEAVWNAGQKHGLKPLGLEALDMLRIEAGLIFANYEFSSETDPFEAGIGFTVPLKSKLDDFIGRAALIQRKEHPRRKLVGLEIESNEAVGHGDPIFMGRGQIGVVTSSTRSPILGKNIALARMDALNSELGNKVEIGKLDGHQKRLPATITKLAAYDPEKTRPRS
jgi:aminomethyltransferase